jgi:hypothetical protein
MKDTKGKRIRESDTREKIYVQNDSEKEDTEG